MSTYRTILIRLPKIRHPSFLPFAQVRHESTTRRHKKLLHLPEAPSYTPSSSHPTLVFNPPSSAPNVYHTPLKFLPRDDSRRKLYATALSLSTRHALQNRTSPISSPGTPLTSPSSLPPKPSSSLPPPVRQPYKKQYHLGEQEIEEIRRLRNEDPDMWTRVRLAEKFGCSQFFVGLVAKNQDKAKRVDAEHEKARLRWGSRRRMAREDRGRRRVAWGRDE